MTSSLLTVMVLTLSAPAPVKEMPKGPPPRVMTLEVTAEGQLVIRIELIDYFMVKKKFAVQVGGKIEERTVEEQVPITVPRLVALEDNVTEVFGPDGKRIDPAEVRKRITRACPVLVSSDGKPVDPFYLSLAREGTLIVVSPKLIRSDIVRPAEKIRVPTPAPPEK